MSPLEKAKLILLDVVGQAASAGISLPERQYAVLGNPVIDCAGVIVALTALVAPEDFDPHCGVPQLGSFTVIISRDCAAMYDEHGNTNMAKADDVSTDLSEDAQFLWDYANGYNEFVSKTWNVGFNISGGLATSSLLLTTGID